MTEHQPSSLYNGIPKEYLDRLQAGHDSITDQVEFQKWLKIQAKFHKYSVNNTMLIWMQRPDASQVMGYGSRDERTGWLSLGRRVRKGEQAIKIFAPVLRKVLVNEDPEEYKQILTGFRLVNVFDVRQTDGPPLPQPPAPRILEGHEGGELYGKLAEVAKTEKLEVKTMSKDAMGEVMGIYLPTQRLIALRENPQLQMTKTFAHELSHHFAEHGTRDEETREDNEMIAEGSAFITMAHHGFDTGDYSFPYLAHWVRQKDQLRSGMNRIHYVSSKLIGAIEGLTKDH